MTKFLRDPLLYFLLGGTALYLVVDRLGDDNDAPVVEVTAAERQRMVAQWQAQMGQPPTPAELEALIDQWIREEIYYRGALDLGLDQDDVIIRRRLAQKLTFLTEDVATGRPAEPQELLDYYANHAERYVEPERFTFSHRYFSGERREQAEADARAALLSPSPEGDPFMLQHSYAERSQREIGELFGQEFAAALADLPVGGWQGPIRSAYGWHLVEIASRRATRRLNFDEVEQRVATDFQQDRRREANEAFYASMRSRYRVVRP